ncbi:hypothetical protein [Tomitella fengzijianii]|uniref:DUF732 domain-containing protein n=1 Tax=Tomitella fengzijianii TaxID=2597660 RepID=A0A516X4F5_9ACTN|nr:hypothetical protein [Tomitella fengzijianii]QDQ97947.1 hypothetical protein FO059_12280 [Tomitella fengzijianii]
MRVRFSAGVVAIAAMGAVLAACGSGGGDTAAAPEESGQAVPTVDATTDVEASDTGGDVDAEAVESKAVDEGFSETLDRLGFTDGEQMTINMWAPSACQAADAMGVSDEQAAGYLVTDLDGQVSVTSEQAAEVWASAKRNVC